MQSLPLKRCCLDGADVALKCLSTLQHWCGLSRCGSSPHWHQCNPIPSEMATFELSTDNKLDGSSPLSSAGHGFCGFQKEYQILVHLATESLVNRIILDELWSREDGGISEWCSHVTSSLHDAALSFICGLQSELCSQTVISRTVPEPIQWCPLENHACFSILPDCSEGLKIRYIQFWPSVLSVAHKRFVDFLMTWCSVDGRMFKAFAILH